MASTNKDNQIKNGNPEFEETLPVGKDMYNTECGIWIFKSKYLEKFANKNFFVAIYGLLGCLSFACACNWIGIISTLEKRFKIRSSISGSISLGTDISQVAMLLFLGYYAGNGHRPRWLALSAILLALNCLLVATPHFIYGRGEENVFSTYDNSSQNNMCQDNRICSEEEGSMIPVVILFISQILYGIGASIMSVVGISFVDDNVEKAKVPIYMCIVYFLQMLGPIIGYTLASFCLTLYISPFENVNINSSDPKWLGAWWLGHLTLIFPLLIISFLLSLFPQTLPKTAARKLKNKEVNVRIKRSFKDFFQSFKRVIMNPVLVLNNFSAIFYKLGYIPFWLFMPKYMEIQYQQSASSANSATGFLQLCSVAMGTLIAGYVITKLKPRARVLAGWNLFVNCSIVLIIISHTFLGCASVDNNSDSLDRGIETSNLLCNMDCNCDFVKYSPVCAETGKTFVSPCHAGCKTIKKYANETQSFSDCACVSKEMELFLNTSKSIGEGSAVLGVCSVDCQKMFTFFIGVVILSRFLFSSEIVANFLVSARSVNEHDKSLAFGFGELLQILFGHFPSPVLFGYILDISCSVWGKTCTGNGNCWLYDTKKLRYLFNFTAAGLASLGVILDVAVWYFSKEIRIFDEKGIEIQLMDEETKLKSIDMKIIKDERLK